MSADSGPLNLADATSVVHDVDIPWVELGPGIEVKMVKSGLRDGIYSMLNRFAPGFEAPKHLHLGAVHGYTLQGRWHYHEYDWWAGSGDYIYEPPDTIHTLHVPDENSEPTLVFFVVHDGMDLYDADGNVFMTQDAKGMMALYEAGLEAKGLELPKSIVA